MEILDLTLNIELDSKARLTISGGSCSGIPNCVDSYPPFYEKPMPVLLPVIELPSFKLPSSPIAMPVEGYDAY